MSSEVIAGRPEIKFVTEVVPSIAVKMVVAVTTSGVKIVVVTIVVVKIVVVTIVVVTIVVVTIIAAGKTIAVMTIGGTTTDRSDIAREVAAIRKSVNSERTLQRAASSAHPPPQPPDLHRQRGRGEVVDQETVRLLTINSKPRKQKQSPRRRHMLKILTSNL